MNINNDKLHNDKLHNDKLYNLIFNQFKFNSITSEIEDIVEIILNSIDNDILNYLSFKIPIFDNCKILFNKDFLDKIYLTINNDEKYFNIIKNISNNLDILSIKNNDDNININILEINNKISEILCFDYDKNYLFSHKIILFYFIQYYELEYENNDSNINKNLKIYYEKFINSYRIYYHEQNDENLKELIIFYYLLSPISINIYLENEISINNSFTILNKNLSKTEEILKITNKILDNNNNIKKLQTEFDIFKNDYFLLLNDDNKKKDSNKYIILLNTMYKEYTEKIL